MKRSAAIRMTCLVIVASGGCVMKSTYDAVVQETEATKTELERTKDEQKILARQVKELEKQNADSTKDTEATITAALRAKSEAEAERRATEDQQAKLREKITLLTNQQGTLRSELAVAKDNSSALKELVDVYKKKLRDRAGGEMESSPPEVARGPKPFDPAKLPPPQDEPTPKPAAEAPAPPAALPPAMQPPPPAQSPAPADAGWLSAIKGWVLALWRAVFS